MNEDQRKIYRSLILPGFSSSFFGSSKFMNWRPIQTYQYMACILYNSEVSLVSLRALFFMLIFRIYQRIQSRFFFWRVVIIFLPWNCNKSFFLTWFLQDSGFGALHAEKASILAQADRLRIGRFLSLVNHPAWNQINGTHPPDRLSVWWIGLGVFLNSFRNKGFPGSRTWWVYLQDSSWPFITENRNPRKVYDWGDEDDDDESDEGTEDPEDPETPKPTIPDDFESPPDDQPAIPPFRYTYKQ